MQSWEQEVAGHPLLAQKKPREPGTYSSTGVAPVWFISDLNERNTGQVPAKIKKRLKNSIPIVSEELSPSKGSTKCFQISESEVALEQLLESQAVSWRPEQAS
jgi:hypothetical protein